MIDQYPGELTSGMVSGIDCLRYELSRYGTVLDMNYLNYKLSWVLFIVLSLNCLGYDSFCVWIVLDMKCLWIQWLGTKFEGIKCQDYELFGYELFILSTINARDKMFWVLLWVFGWILFWVWNISGVNCLERNVGNELSKDETSGYEIS